MNWPVGIPLRLRKHNTLCDFINKGNSWRCQEKKPMGEKKRCASTCCLSPRLAHLRKMNLHSSGLFSLRTASGSIDHPRMARFAFLARGKNARSPLGKLGTGGATIIWLGALKYDCVMPVTCTGRCVSSNIACFHDERSIIRH